MKLRFKIGEEPAQTLYASVKELPSVGDVVRVVDKATHGSKPFPVRVTSIVTHIGGGDIFFVDRVV